MRTHQKSRKKINLTTNEPAVFYNIFYNCDETKIIDPKTKPKDFWIMTYHSYGSVALKNDGSRITFPYNKEGIMLKNFINDLTIPIFISKTGIATPKPTGGKKPIKLPNLTYVYNFEANSEFLI